MNADHRNGWGETHPIRWASIGPARHVVWSRRVRAWSMCSRRIGRSWARPVQGESRWCARTRLRALTTRQRPGGLLPGNEPKTSQARSESGSARWRLSDAVVRPRTYRGRQSARANDCIRQLRLARRLRRRSSSRVDRSFA